jgi:ring-1,2-phenylacetyl-CoA epoxidase subunit PaaB
VHDEFVAGFTKAVENAVVGDPTGQVLMGPLLDQKFAEPVSLSSTVLADFPLPRTAFEVCFDLLALRARRKRQPNGSHRRLQGGRTPNGGNSGNFPAGVVGRPPTPPGQVEMAHGLVHAVDREMALQNARDVYGRRGAVSMWVVPTDAITASSPDDAGPFFDPADDKPYRHPQFYKTPRGVRVY